MKIAAVVVTYNRLDLLKRTINAIRSQTRPLDEIVVVNNGSTDGTREYLSSLDDVTVINLEENIGGSGGFHEGIKYVLCRGDHDWIWLMDDDAVPERDSLRRLMEAYEGFPRKLKERIGVLQSQMVGDFDAVPPPDIKTRPVLFGMFVGYLLRRSVVEEVGLPRRDFFIYYDDAEYSLRIRRRGYRIFKVLGSFIYHKDWAKLRRVRRFPVSKPDIPPWKGYYIFRNGFLMFRNPLVRFALFVYFSFDLLLWMYVKPEVVPYAFRGLIDGVKGISGKVVDPRGR